MTIGFERELENDEDVEMIECHTCEGMGGWDRSTDCETYDDWLECPECTGSGLIER